MNVTPTPSPSPRAGAALATYYGPPTNGPGTMPGASLILFGGRSGSTAAPEFLSDTWAYSAGTWHPVVTAPGPPGRYTPTLTFGVPDEALLLFGGINATGSLNDTWTLTPGPGSDQPVLDWLPYVLGAALGVTAVLVVYYGVLRAPRDPV